MTIYEMEGADGGIVEFDDEEMAKLPWFRPFTEHAGDGRGDATRLEREGVVPSGWIVTSTTLMAIRELVRAQMRLEARFPDADWEGGVLFRCPKQRTERHFKPNPKKRRIHYGKVHEDVRDVLHHVIRDPSPTALYYATRDPPIGESGRAIFLRPLEFAMMAQFLRYLGAEGIAHVCELCLADFVRNKDVKWFVREFEISGHDKWAEYLGLTNDEGLPEERWHKLVMARVKERNGWILQYPKYDPNDEPEDFFTLEDLEREEREEREAKGLHIEPPRALGEGLASPPSSKDKEGDDDDDALVMDVDEDEDE